MASGVIEPRNKLEMIYNENGIVITRQGRSYSMRFIDTTPSQYTNAKSAIVQFFPSSLSATLWTSKDGIYYLATLNYANNDLAIKVLGTYGSVPSSFESTTHVLHGIVTWQK